MPTTKQLLGVFGEKLVAKNADCPRCKRKKTLKTLPQNFECADVICNFCGFLAQVKSVTARKGFLNPPKTISGAAWGPLRDRMESGIYFSLYIVVVPKNWFETKDPDYVIYYLPAELQLPEIFIARKPLSDTAKRAGWQGVTYDLSPVQDSIVKLLAYEKI